jgi:GNAT superfamily N-acetyltransferase
MKLTAEQKEQFELRLWNITELCYNSVEVPTREFFKRCVRQGDVFLDYNSYALVTADWGDERTPLLRSIATPPKCRGMGRASALLDEIAIFYRGQNCKEIVLHCKVDNPAQRLYFKKGYRVTAVLRGYYKPEGNGLEMRLVL